MLKTRLMKCFAFKSQFLVGLYVFYSAEDKHNEVDLALYYSLAKSSVDISFDVFKNTSEVRIIEPNQCLKDCSLKTLNIIEDHGAEVFSFRLDSIH
jgi:hypothetical protein